jgi:ribosomal protein S18 acetylase RimI-like enzyme
MLIREARETEITEILGLLQWMDGEEALDTGQALKIWQQMKKYPYYKVFVVEDGQKLVGVCSLIIIENWGHRGSKFAVADNVVVDPAYRGRGVGTALMRFVREQAEREACYKLMLSSNKKRTEAHRFYEKLGFEQHGISFMIEGKQND